MRQVVLLLATMAGLVLLLVNITMAGHMEHRGMAIQLDNAWARRAPMIGQETPSDPTAFGNGAVYVAISNHGSQPDALVAAVTEAATSVELHETVDQGGKMVMRPLPKFDVPAGGKLEMKPGSYHIMLLRLKQDLKPGDTVNLTLTFEKAGLVSVHAPVK
jgi:periplasmic copper chaperone A